MTVPAQSDASTILQAVRAARQLTASFEAMPFDTVISDSLFARTLTATVDSELLSPMLPDFAAAAELGHSFTIRIQDDGPIDIRYPAHSDPDVSGSAEFAADPLLRQQLERAIDLQNAAEILDALPGRSWNLRAVLAARHSTVVWLPSAELLLGDLQSASWVSTLVQFFDLAQAGCRTFLVDNLTAPVLTPDYAFLPAEDGAAAQPSASTATMQTAAAFVAARRDEGWPTVPSPLAVLPIEDQLLAPSLLATALRASAAALVWLWLASEAPVVTPDSATVEYQGLRNTKFALAPQLDLAEVELQRTFKLWRWATVSDEGLRRDAAIRAISIAVTSSADTAAGAEPALRTARTLYNLATSAAVAEALSTRRAGREAAANAAFDAAQAARTTAGSATQRSLALLAAGAGLVLASVQKVLPWWSSATALIVLAALLAGALVIAQRVDLASARGVIAGFKVDAETYREALSDDDLQALKDLRVLQNAEADIRRTEIAVACVYVASAVVSLVFAGVLAAVRPGN